MNRENGMLHAIRNYTRQQRTMPDQHSQQLWLWKWHKTKDSLTLAADLHDVY